MKFKEIEKVPDVPTVILIEALLMPNGEVLHLGKSLGFPKISRIYKVDIDDLA